MPSYRRISVGAIKRIRAVTERKQTYTLLFSETETIITINMMTMIMIITMILRLV